MVHSAVGIIREVKQDKNGKGHYVVDFKDQDGNVHSAKSWAMKETKYEVGDSISIRYYSFGLLGKNVIITDRIDDVKQNNDTIVISSASAVGIAAVAVVAILVVNGIRKSLKKEEK